MTSFPKTIQIFLPDGNPRSVRIAEITSRTVQAIEVPRTKLDVAASRGEVRQHGLYFLFSEGEDLAKPRVYVGESRDCYTRLTQHHQKKDFWTRAVVVSSKSHRFDKAQVSWLEWHAVDQAARIGRYRVENKAGLSEPHVSEPVRADLLDTFGTARVLLATLGFPIFEEIHVADRAPEVFTLSARGVTARAEYVEDGLLMLAGSEAALELVRSAHGKYPDNVRRPLIAEGVLVRDGDRYVFAQDHLFTTPSAAGAAVMGRFNNGWKHWKAPDGRTLNELKRRTAP